MPPAIRALVVAENVATRRFVSHELGCASGLEVIGTAPNTKIALTKIASLRPDVITVSPEMPEDGALHLIREIRRTQPRLPVIVFSVFSVPRADEMRVLM